MTTVQSDIGMLLHKAENEDEEQIRLYGENLKADTIAVYQEWEIPEFVTEDTIKVEYNGNKGKIINNAITAEKVWD